MTEGEPQQQVSFKERIMDSVLQLISSQKSQSTSHQLNASPSITVRARRTNPDQGRRIPPIARAYTAPTGSPSQVPRQILPQIHQDDLDSQFNVAIVVSEASELEKGFLQAVAAIVKKDIGYFVTMGWMIASKTAKITFPLTFALLFGFWIPFAFNTVFLTKFIGWTCLLLFFCCYPIFKIHSLTKDIYKQSKHTKPKPTTDTDKLHLVLASDAFLFCASLCFVLAFDGSLLARLYGGYLTCPQAISDVNLSPYVNRGIVTLLADKTFSYSSSSCADYNMHADARWPLGSVRVAFGRISCVTFILSTICIKASEKNSDGTPIDAPIDTPIDSTELIPQIDQIAKHKVARAPFHYKGASTLVILIVFLIILSLFKNSTKTTLFLGYRSSKKTVIDPPDIYWLIFVSLLLLTIFSAFFSAKQLPTQQTKLVSPTESKNEKPQTGRGLIFFLFLLRLFLTVLITWYILVVIFSIASLDALFATGIPEGCPDDLSSITDLTIFYARGFVSEINGTAQYSEWGWQNCTTSTMRW
eukprot:gnl/Dysnectes_brevis/1827_a2097_772.p1 GENE.gnl/Dysnectes_brevis/1827_a2097_772~~gnl/Dysnectes_brevis/1827_a2097_772.p1  ORF type:complete len:529 (-),score=-44.71 gnl/Dysnectes_brevis/1827_a2097_772:71-1657(-)